MFKQLSVNDQDLDAAYKAMAQDKVREAEALEWVEATIRDISDGDADFADERRSTKNLRASAASAS